MAGTKADIIARLQKEILPFQGFRPSQVNTLLDISLGPVRYAFPNHTFPLGAIHEFICENAFDTAASNGFMAGILAGIMKNNGVILWTGAERLIFPPTLKLFGMNPSQVIFVDVKKEKEVLWVMEEALKCDSLAAVVGEIRNIDFTESRRMQLAVEQSRVTGFIIRNKPRKLNTTACVTRWQVTSLPSMNEDDMPGVGFPRWNVSLLKVRNGKPGSWPVEWRAGKFKHVNPIISIPQELRKKTG